MYINLAQIGKKLVRGDLEILVALKQVNTDYLLNELSENDLKRFEDLDFIERVKTYKKTDHPYKCLRLTKLAKQFLVDCSYEGSPDEQSEKITDWLVEVYKNKSGGIIKNKTEARRRIHWFKTITSIEGNYLAVLLQCFIQDTYDSTLGESVKDFMERNSRGVLSNMLDNVFWNPPNIMARHYTLADSPLCIYYENNRGYIEQRWNDLLDEEGNKK